MRIVIRKPKPRNPVAAPAKQRHAGRHGAYREERRERRIGKQAVLAYLSGRRDELE